MEEHGRVGSILVTNRTICSSQFCELASNTMDDCFEQTTDWAHKTTWKFYALKPRPKTPEHKLCQKPRKNPPTKKKPKKSESEKRKCLPKNKATTTRTRNTLPTLYQRSGVTLGDQIKELSWIFTAFRLYYESKEQGGKIITIAEIKERLPMIDSSYKMLQDYLEVLPDYASTICRGSGFSGKNSKKRRRSDDFLVSYESLPPKRRKISNSNNVAQKT